MYSFIDAQPFQSQNYIIKIEMKLALRFDKNRKNKLKSNEIVIKCI